jgi:hypothetical protein
MRVKLGLVENKINDITTNAPYIIAPRNCKAARGEFDEGNDTLAAYLNNDKVNSFAATIESVQEESCIEHALLRQ